jgi:hypothetical protein
VYGWAESRSGSILSPQLVQILPGNICLAKGIISIINCFSVLVGLSKLIVSLKETIPVSSNL